MDLTVGCFNFTLLRQHCYEYDGFVCDELDLHGESLYDFHIYFISHILLTIQDSTPHVLLVPLFQILCFQSPIYFNNFQEQVHLKCWGCLNFFLTNAFGLPLLVLTHCLNFVEFRQLVWHPYLNSVLRLLF